MKLIRKTLIILLTCAVLFTGALFSAYLYFNAPPASGEATSFTVTKGMTLRQAADRLKKEGAIRNSDFLVLLSCISGTQNIKTGRYRITADAHSSDILQKLTRGTVDTIPVTIPEGYNIYKIAEELEDAGICGADAFLHAAYDREFLHSLGIDAPSVEGYLYPDTYSFAAGTDPYAIIKHLKEKMDTVLASLNYKEHMPENMSRHQLLIIASLVEKEAQLQSEQRLIASVFLNRVDRGMRFDSDPTVRYAVRKFTGRIRYRDLESDSPYNTYRTAGYPPTPIASPGRSAIEAVLHPEESSYLYFVSRNDGSHYFSRNLSRHNKAVDYYQKGIRNGFHDEQR